MTAFYRTLLYTFVVFLSIFYRLTYSQSPTTSSISPIVSNSNNTTNFTNTSIDTNSALSSSSTSFSNSLASVSTTNSISSSDISTTPTTTVSGSINTNISVDQSTTSSVNNTRPPDGKFLRNWRSRDDDADNIILQLEQSEISPGQWPPRISFT
ncbi:unnamed protein product [Rotaria sordida]|uniref:Uncharacterized protein n=1 Tax=Rotaria sordida TaxID=392033 RepID=A0A818UH22_9BILA|nr:unnamed protein product [Rotaria sordida]